MKIGLVSFAHVHADRYYEILCARSDIEPGGIFDTDVDRGKNAAERYGSRYFSSLDALLANGLDGVVVCSENGAHRDHCIAAFDAGVNVLCEKPIATTLADARAIVSAADASGVTLKIAFTTRFSKGGERLRSLVTEGRLGDPIAMTGANRGKNPGGWFVDAERAGGGSMIDHIVHILDLTRWVFRIEPARVFAECDTFFADIPTEDAGLVLVEFSSGVPLTIDASWSKPPEFPTWGDNVVEIRGTRGTAVMNTQGERAVRYGGCSPDVAYVPFGRNTSENMIADFCEAISGRESIGAGGEDGYAALEVAVAAYRSAQLHKTVDLPLTSSAEDRDGR